MKVLHELKIAQPQTEKTQSTEQDLGSVLDDRRQLRKHEQLKQNLDVSSQRNTNTSDHSHKDVREWRPLQQFAKRTAHRT